MQFSQAFPFPWDGEMRTKTPKGHSVLQETQQVRSKHKGEQEFSRVQVMD